ncbi:hypothetical protein V2J09_007532 [Rumex salicifolius]
MECKSVKSSEAGCIQCSAPPPLPATVNVVAGGWIKKPVGISGFKARKLLPGDSMADVAARPAGISTQDTNPGKSPGAGHP